MDSGKGREIGANDGQFIKYHTGLYLFFRSPSYTLDFGGSKQKYWRRSICKKEHFVEQTELSRSTIAHMTLRGP